MDLAVYAESSFFLGIYFRQNILYENAIIFLPNLSTDIQTKVGNNAFKEISNNKNIRLRIQRGPKKRIPSFILG